jgi:membrane protease YdiL (CAAX protease family)
MRQKVSTKFARFLGDLMDCVRIGLGMKLIVLMGCVFSAQAAMSGSVEGQESIESEPYLGAFSSEEIAALGVISSQTTHFDGSLNDPFFFPQNEYMRPPLESTSKFLDPQAIPSMDLEFPKPQKYKSPFAAVSLSVVFPGLGHAYLGDLKTAGGLIGTTGLSIGAASAFHSDEVAFFTSLATASNTWLYGIYAAYRDVRIYNGQPGYSYQMPTDSFADLAYAPFNYKVLKKPEVWGGLLGSLALAVGIGYLAFHDEIFPQSSHSLNRGFTPLVALPVGIGEESFFRGFLQSQLAESLTPWGGIAVSSLLFGASHIGNGMALEPGMQKGYYKFVLPFLTLAGVYEGWLTYKNGSLKSSVALHTWYDFVLFTLGSLAPQAVLKGRAEFAIALPF